MKKKDFNWQIPICGQEKREIAIGKNQKQLSFKLFKIKMYVNEEYTLKI